MKLCHLFESERNVALKDIFTYQDNSDLDQDHIDSVAQDFEAGEHVEPVLVRELTAKFKQDLKKLKEELSKTTTHKEYAENIDPRIFTTTKKWMLMDGNHRFLAAKKAKKAQIRAEISTISPKDFVNFLHFGYE